MLMAASTVMGDIVPSNIILIIYIFFFPILVIFMGLLMKKMEPVIMNIRIKMSIKLNVFIFKYSFEFLIFFDL